MRILVAGLLAATLGGCVTVMGPNGPEPIFRTHPKAPHINHHPAKPSHPAVVYKKAEEPKKLEPKYEEPKVDVKPEPQPEPKIETPNVVVKKRWYDRFKIHPKWFHHH
jgi:hypothetical protein